MTGTEIWVKTVKLDDNHEHSTEVEVPDRDRVILNREEMVRFLTEAGYERKEDE